MKFAAISRDGFRNSCRPMYMIHWASKETCHFFRATLTKIYNIKTYHIYLDTVRWKSSSWSTLEKSKGCSCHKGEKCGEIAKGCFSKITAETAHWDPPWKAAYSAYSIAIHSIFNDRLYNHRIGFCPWQTQSPGGEQFLWCLKKYLLWFHCMFLHFHSSKPLCF